MAFRYSTRNEELDREIERLIELADAGENADLIQQMVVTAIKLVGDEPERGDLKIINSALKEMRYAFKVFKNYRRDRKVSVFGSARTPEDSEDYRQAVEFSRRMAEHGFMCITGAGNGIMKAGHEGAGRAMSMGANIRLPFEQQANSVIEGDPKLVNFKYFFTRKLAFLKETHAVICFPGGFGTHDEGFEVLTLVQTGKSHLLPIIFVHPPGKRFWHQWDEYVREHLLMEKLISPEDTSLYLVTDSVDKAVEEVIGFYRRYHSSRYVGDNLIIRLESPLRPEEIDLLNEEFADLLMGGKKIEPVSMLPQEANDPDIAHLPRLKLRFARRRFGRLRQLVDRINSFPLPPDAVIEVPEVGEGGAFPAEVDED